MLISDLLFITQTHGDEILGTRVIKSLKKELSGFDFVIGNKEAAKNKKRFIKYDLNRIAPGDIASNDYEIRRAGELIKLSKKYKVVVDVHCTLSNTGVCIIVTNPTRKNLELAKKFPVERIVVWENDVPMGPPTAFMKCAVEIESGPLGSGELGKELREVISAFVTQDTSGKDKSYYKVIGKLSGLNTKEKNRLKEFEETNINGKKVIPFMIGQYKDKIAYSLKRVSLDELKD